MWKDTGQLPQVLEFVKECSRKLVTQKEMCTYLNLDEIYQENEIENYDTDYVGQILKMDAKKFKRLVEDADIKLAKTIAGRAVELFRNGKFDSRIKEEVLCARLNREDLFEM